MKFPRISMALKATAFFLFLFLLSLSAAHALILNVSYIDESGGNHETWTATEKNVINQAIADWQSVIGNNVSINFTMRFQAAGTNSFLGLWGASVSPAPGTDLRPWTVGITHNITINSDFMNLALTNRLFFDPTPGDIGADVPFPHFDALSVVRHEIGHMLGFTDDFYLDDISIGNIDLWDNRINASHIFNAGGLNIPMDADHAHTADIFPVANDLMNVALFNGSRYGISSTDLSMLSLVYGYNIIPEPSTFLMVIMALVLMGLFCGRKLRSVRAEA